MSRMCQGCLESAEGQTQQTLSPKYPGEGVCVLREDGADDEIRTRDIDLGKVALYQLSYIRRPALANRGRGGRDAT
jgi:hypothetical protein